MITRKSPGPSCSRSCALGLVRSTPPIKNAMLDLSNACDPSPDTNSDFRMPDDLARAKADLMLSPSKLDRSSCLLLEMLTVVSNVSIARSISLLKGAALLGVTAFCPNFPMNSDVSACRALLTEVRSSSGIMFALKMRLNALRLCIAESGLISVRLLPLGLGLLVCWKCTNALIMRTISR